MPLHPLRAKERRWVICGITRHTACLNKALIMLAAGLSPACAGRPVHAACDPVTGCVFPLHPYGEAAAQVAPLRAACPPAARFIMVTATLAASVFAQLTQEFPGILPAFGPGKPCKSQCLEHRHLCSRRWGPCGACGMYGDTVS